ncbi:MAG: hypothetical protein GX557_01540, partial [Chloroflexi bacterium]|nr:hypothetical protein [Chloroflexota bacterium]
MPPLNYLMLDGVGDPNSAQQYAEALEALYALSYALKFACKRRLGVDYVVSPLEGLWWTPDMALFSTADKAAWNWTMMIAQPAPVTAELVAATLDEVRRKKALPALAQVRYETLNEGLCVQIMHIGPYAAEAPTIARMHAHIAALGYVPA